jgi:hypothetical protein
MAGYDDDDDKLSGDEDEQKEEPWRFAMGRDALIYLIDASEAMYEECDVDGEPSTLVKMCLKVLTFIFWKNNTYLVHALDYGYETTVTSPCTSVVTIMNPVSLHIFRSRLGEVDSM